MAVAVQEGLADWPWAFVIPTVIALAALSVSVWGLCSANAKASLEVVPQNTGPAAYALRWSTKNKVLDLRIPLVIVNTGARPGAFLDARILIQEWSGGVPFHLHRFYDTLDPRDTTDHHRFAHPVVVSGRSSEMRFAQFRAEPPPAFTPDTALAVGTYELCLEWRTDAHREWHVASRFKIEIDERARSGMLDDKGNVHWNPADRGPLVPGTE